MLCEIVNPPSRKSSVTTQNGRQARTSSQYNPVVAQYPLTPSQKSLPITSGSSSPIQQFATFKNAEPYQHLPTPALEPPDQLLSLANSSSRGGPPAPSRRGTKRDRSVDIFEKHALTKPRVDDDGQPFTFKTGAAAEFENPVLEQQQPVPVMDLRLPRNRSRGSLPQMSAEDAIRAEARVKEVVVIKERSRERDEATRMSMGNVQKGSSPLPSPRRDGIFGLAQRARDRTRSGSRNRWEQGEVVDEGLEGKQKGRSLTVMTGSVEEEEEENPRTGRSENREWDYANSEAPSTKEALP